MSADLDICIVSYNARQLLGQCLRSLFATLGARSPRAQVWVADNGSPDASADLVRREFPAVRLIENRQNLGFARANNQLLTLGRAPYALLLNSDTIVQPGAIERLFTFMEEHPRAGAVGAELLNTDGTVQWSWSAFPTLWSELVGREPRPYRPLALSGGGLAYQVDWVGGGCLLARRRAIDQVGLLDERFFMYSEETDWCRRLRQAGWECYYLPGARVIHLGGGSSGRGNPAMLAQLYRSKLCYFRKHHGALQAECLRVGLAARLALRAALEAAGYLLSGGRYRRGARLARQRLALAGELARAHSGDGGSRHERSRA